MPKIPKQRKPGQSGNWSGQGKNAQTFNARQKSGKKGVFTCLILAVITGLTVGTGAFMAVVLVL